MTYVRFGALLCFILFFCYLRVLSKGDVSFENFLEKSQKSDPGLLQDQKKEKKAGDGRYEAILRKKLLGYSKKWVTLMAVPGEKRICYSLIYSDSRIGNYVSLGVKPYFMVHRIGEGKERVSVFFGYELLKLTPVYLSIDGRQFVLYPYKEFAFARSADVDSEIIRLLKSAKSIMLRGDGSGGYYAVDKYLVGGFDEAHEKMKKYCS